jgi:hypothetical protein
MNGIVNPSSPLALLDHKMALQQSGSSTKAPHLESTTEFEILKSSHQYVTWNALWPF